MSYPPPPPASLSLDAAGQPPISLGLESQEELSTTSPLTPTPDPILTPPLSPIDEEVQIKSTELQKYYSSSFYEAVLLFDLLQKQNEALDGQLNLVEIYKLENLIIRNGKKGELNSKDAKVLKFFTIWYNMRLKRIKTNLMSLASYFLSASTGLIGAETAVSTALRATSRSTESAAGLTGTLAIVVAVATSAGRFYLDERRGDGGEIKGLKGQFLISVGSAICVALAG